MNIRSTLEGATAEQVSSAVGLVADSLHVPNYMITPTIAVAYIQKHYGTDRIGAPESRGWEGFVADLGDR